MNNPTPAIVAQSAVRRFPRWVLWLFCVTYVLAGFLGRDAWKSADMVSLGFMTELTQETSHWLKPTLMGVAPESPSLLPLWLGAWTMQLAPATVAADFVVRIPFAMLLALALIATWYGTYYLARSPLAQPVAFAFGGEALPSDYARAIADGSVLAFIACLGLAQLSHETTPALAQLGFTSLLFFALGALPYARRIARTAAVMGLLGLTLSGAPFLAAMFGLGGVTIHLLDRSHREETTQGPQQVALDGWIVAIAMAASIATASHLDLWSWKIDLPTASWADVNGIAQLLLWFTWPAWPLVLWTLWRWRHQLLSREMNRHLALPAWFTLVAVVACLATGRSDRTLLLGLPAMATLAAFALPTLKRQVAALIDWFTLLFFSSCGLTIWVIWIAMQTGVPWQPAANVARLAPGFVATFSLFEFSIAVVATLFWAWLVKWRVGRHRKAIWTSLVLPSGGAALCWLLLMTLWMPLLNYAQSYRTVVERTLAHIDAPGCIETTGLAQGQIAALQVYGKLTLQAAGGSPHCLWLLAEPGPDLSMPMDVDQDQWRLHGTARHPVDGAGAILVLQRKTGEAAH